MAVNNSLTKSTKQDQSITYMAGNESVTLSPSIVKNYLVSGDSDKVSLQEIVMFLNLCKFQHLNPFLREAYLVKYGNEPATIVVGKDAFKKRAQRNPKYQGDTAGVIVRKDDEIEHRVGSMVLKDEILVGGWAKVFVKGYLNPVEITVGYDEYVGKKKDGSPNRQWSSKPGTMLRKVALVQALREAFPDDFEGMYDADEMGLDSTTLSDTPIDIPAEQPESKPPTVEESEVMDLYEIEQTNMMDDPLG